MDREKVIEGLEICTKDIPMSNAVHKSDLCKECPYYNAEYSYCWNQIVMMRDALALLKEREVGVKPHYNARSNWYECGNCRYSMTSGMHCRAELIPAYKVGFCAKCGKAVKWE